MRLEVLPVEGIGEVTPGTDLARLIADTKVDLRDGDVVVVTSKIVSKSEGRIADSDREGAIDAETVRVVARRGDTRIVQTRHGFVMAAAGVDASNVAKGSVVLLPVDADASARKLRGDLRALLGVNVGVVVTDTFGRPWRNGVTDVAIGVAGLDALDDLRGVVDAYGNELQVTVTCIVDEIAAAADLVKGKLSGVPVAIVRGLRVVRAAEVPDTQGIRPVVRPADEDMFSLGTHDVLPARTDVREFTDAPVDVAAVRRALRAGDLAARLSSRHAVSFLVVESLDLKTSLKGLLGDPAAASAALFVVPCLDEPVSDVDLLGAGAAVENVLVALAIERLGANWSWHGENDAELAAALGLDAGVRVLGVIAVGHPARSAS